MLSTDFCIICTSTFQGADIEGGTFESRVAVLLARKTFFGFYNRKSPVIDE